MKTIVLIEDDHAIQEAFSMVMNRNGYDVQSYDDGEQVLKKEVQPPDLFVVDKNVPGLNGLDICRFLRNEDRYKNVPVIMMSAYPDIITMGKLAGADDVITKPFSLSTLREVVSKHLL